MKFILSKEVLVDVYNKIGKILSGNSSIPILNGVLITANGGKIEFTASNGVESILLRVINDPQKGIEVIEPGSVVLPKEIFNVTKKLKSGEIEFTANDTLTQIQVKQNKTKLNFAIDLAEQYPSVSSGNNPTGNFMIPAKEFEEIIKTTSFAVAKSESRPVLTGIHFRLAAKDNGLAYHVVSTDSHRLAKISNTTEFTEEIVTFTLPATALNQAIKSFELKGDVAIVTYQKQVALVNGNIIIFCQLLEGNYPDTNRLIPDATSMLTLNRNELIDALELISAMQNKSNAIFSVLGNSVLLESKVDTSHIQQEIQVVENNDVEDGFKITFSCDYALDALRTIHTENVLMEINGSQRPFIFKNVFEADQKNPYRALQLILPLRTF